MFSDEITRAMYMKYTKKKHYKYSSLILLLSLYNQNIFKYGKIQVPICNIVLFSDDIIIVISTM